MRKLGNKRLAVEIMVIASKIATLKGWDHRDVLILTQAADRIDQI